MVAEVKTGQDNTGKSANRSIHFDQLRDGGGLYPIDRKGLSETLQS